MRRLVAVYANGELSARPDPQRAAAWSARLQAAERR
jgi:hypothetical protein